MFTIQGRLSVTAKEKEELKAERQEFGGYINWKRVLDAHFVECFTINRVELIRAIEPAIAIECDRLRIPCRFCKGEIRAKTPYGSVENSGIRPINEPSDNSENIL